MILAPCTRPPAGWSCSREYGHDGPCPTRLTDAQTRHDLMLEKVESVIEQGLRIGANSADIACNVVGMVEFVLDLED